MRRETHITCLGCSQYFGDDADAAIQHPPQCRPSRAYRLSRILRAHMWPVALLAFALGMIVSRVIL